MTLASTANCQVRRFAATLVVAAASLALVGCGAEAPLTEDQTLGSGQTQELTAYTPPPMRPPSAWVGNLLLKPTMTQWRIDGRYAQSDISHEDALPVNDLPIRDQDSVTIRIDAANPGTEVKVRLFDQLASNGYPLSGNTGDEYDCTRAVTSPCSMSLEEDGNTLVTIRATDPGRVRMFVIQAFYPSLEAVDVRSNITDYSISWAVRNEG